MADTNTKNYQELWSAIRAEHNAKADKFSAERKMKYNNAFNDLGKEVSAMGDWTEASWDQFKAKINRKWQEMAIETKTDDK
jgi:vacuolar-type H+-ATPase catalytic subunit A/Vma1